LTLPECANNFGAKLIEEKLSLLFVKPEIHEKKGYKKPESHLWDSGSNSKSINKELF
jgi:hypothetical protein